ncbi:MAG TPA: DUF1871 family protein [Sporosarcina sp.]|nr:DUF1871 family protein [Sporosarcina sp.]
MDLHEMNRKAVNLLEQWDPFQQEKEAYEETIKAVVEALDLHDHPMDLAKSMRMIYEQSFHLWIPIEDCVQVAYKLLALKYEAKSIV